MTRYHQTGRNHWHQRPGYRYAKPLGSGPVQPMHQPSWLERLIRGK